MTQAAVGSSSSSLSFSVLLRQLRPRQWTKNLVILAPLLFGKALFIPDSVQRALAAVASFCLLASGIYILNDWMDREKDRLHPEKRSRPIAAGLMGAPLAAVMLVTCWIGGSLLALWVGRGFPLVAGSYVLMQIAYSLGLKRVVILDVLMIAVGFVLRVIGGGVAINVPVSNWLYLCTLLLAVFLGFAKRRHELASLQESAGSHRANLSEYSLPMLDQMISVVAAACLVAYGLYTVSRETVENVGSDRLKFTLPFVLYGLFRYLFLIHRAGATGTPEKVLLSDRPILLCVLLYIVVSGAVLYF
ncbi:MAG: decaprenyl-phosphate phosphoribosyltransferase [Myxococcaceae bacterium]